MKNSRSRILWIDCLGGLFVGCVVLLAYGTLSKLEHLPVSVVISMGLVNLFYGTFSLFVTTRQPRPPSLVKTLAIANMLWLIVCVAIAASFWQEISPLGLLHVIGEGIYVAALGLTEWSWRHILSDETATAL